MKQFFAQKDETCMECGSELTRGSNIYVNAYEEVLCEDCKQNSDEVGGEMKMD